MIRKSEKENAKNKETTDDLSPLKKASLTGVSVVHLSASELANKVALFLDEKKARDITLIDISNKTIIADYFVIASARSTTAVRGLTEYVDEKLSKDYAIEPLRRDMDSKWCAIDYGSVIMHVFYEETRQFYQLERLWSDGGNIKQLTTDNE